MGAENKGNGKCAKVGRASLKIPTANRKFVIGAVRTLVKPEAPKSKGDYRLGYE